jgi:SagB-type dehydrogenase family enzyme
MGGEIMDGIGDKFQKATKYDPLRMPAGGLDWSAQPPLYKDYPDHPKISLEAFEPDKLMPLHNTLKTRRSVRRFRREPISKAQLSYLLWASTGIQRVEGGYEFRTAPSAGALYPIETYIAANSVSDLESGLYHYSVKHHQLEQLSKGDYGTAVAKAALGQSMCAQAAAVFVWSAVFQRCKWKYGQRAYRYIYLDAGHIAENLALAAVSLNLGSCEIGALYDDQVNAILGVDGTDESVICMAALGHPA